VKVTSGDLRTLLGWLLLAKMGAEACCHVAGGSRGLVHARHFRSALKILVSSLLADEEISTER
jgi:hypothetical protein